MKPEWLKIKGSSAQERKMVTELLSELNLNTVCHEAACPNMGECFARRTATFMILGIQCTRGCKFCNVQDGNTEEIDASEPKRVAEAVAKLNLKHVVVTSVTRDDLEDGGAGHFAETIRAVSNKMPSTAIEVLIPDFKLNHDALGIVAQAEPTIIAHNMETVKALYDQVRPEAGYEQSLNVLAYIKELNPEIHTKSGIMLGLGETYEQVIEVLSDLRKVDCDFLTIGQYLAPSKAHHPVIDYVHPEQFKAYKEIAYEMGFKYVASDPLVRSSYHADEALDQLI